MKTLIITTAHLKALDALRAALNEYIADTTEKGAEIAKLEAELEYTKKQLRLATTAAKPLNELLKDKGAEIAKLKAENELLDAVLGSIRQQLDTGE